MRYRCPRSPPGCLEKGKEGLGHGGAALLVARKYTPDRILLMVAGETMFCMSA